MRVRPTIPLLAVLLAACAGTADLEPAAPQDAPGPEILRIDERLRGQPSVLVRLDEPGHVALFYVSSGHRTTLLFPNYAEEDNELEAGRHRIALPAEASVPRYPCRENRYPAGVCRDTRIPGLESSRVGVPWVLLIRSRQPLDLDAIAEDLGGYPHRHSPELSKRLRRGNIESVTRFIMENVAAGTDWLGFACRRDPDSPYCLDSYRIDPETVESATG